MSKLDARSCVREIQTHFGESTYHPVEIDLAGSFGSVARHGLNAVRSGMDLDNSAHVG
jgi:hypothetical protein